MSWQVLEADCVAAMREMDEASVDAVVTDPPYGLEFMGKEWDRLGGGERKTSKPGIGERTTGWVSNRGWNAMRCRNCGHLSHGGSPCQCDAPDFAAADDRMRLMQEWHQAWATEALRVLKPGGHLLAFGGTRTYHRLACAVEDAGFEIRDSVIWLYGSGFPKSLDVSKAIDKRGGNVSLTERIGQAIKAAREKRGWSVGKADKHFCGGTTNWTWFEGRPTGQRAPTTETFARIVVEWPELANLAEAVAEAEREKIGVKRAAIGLPGMSVPEAQKQVDITAAATPEAQRWQGFGTSLKPAHEPIVVARKPLIGTVAQNVERFGTGALAIDACRIGYQSDGDAKQSARTGDYDAYDGSETATDALGSSLLHGEQHAAGRWPANVVLDEAAAAELDRQSGEGKSPRPYERRADGDNGWSGGWGWGTAAVNYGDTGGASRFFATFPWKYQAKASRAERNAGLEGFEERAHRRYGEQGQGPNPQQTPRVEQVAANVHPTVKPVALMRWLCRLVTPPGGTILDPFLGSGSTGVAAVLEGFDFVGVEREAEYCRIAEARINWWDTHKDRADEILAISAKSERERTEHRDAGQLSLEDAA